MRRFISLLLAAILSVSCILSLSSCHGTTGAAAFEMPEEFDENKQYEITFWAKNDKNVKQTKVYQKAIADFEALYPNIKVNLKLYYDYGRIYEDVITNIATGTTPNVCISYPDHIATYKTGTNVVVPLDGLIADEKYGLGGSELRFDGPDKGEVVAKFLAEGVIDGEQYALPFMRSTEACYVNKTYVEALGFEMPEILSWDFIFEVSAAATEKNDDGTYKVNGQEIMIPFIYKSTDNMMIQMLAQLGAGYSTEGGEIGIFNDDTKSILYTVADSTEIGAFSTFKVASYPANSLNRGQCIFAIDSTAGATWMGPEAPLSDIKDSESIVEFETVVTTIPQFDVENPRMISQGPSVCVFNKSDSGEVLASWLFAQFLLTNDVQLGYSATEGYVPVTTKAQESEEYQDYLARGGEDNDTYYKIKIDAAKLLIENTENTFITPVFNGSAALRNVAGQLIESVVATVRGKTDEIDDGYLEKLFSDVSSMYHIDQRVEGGADKPELGEMPVLSVILLISLAVIWLLLGSCVLWRFFEARKSRKNRS